MQIMLGRPGLIEVLADRKILKLGAAKRNGIYIPIEGMSADGGRNRRPALSLYYIIMIKARM